ncbi:MAG: hypothetical protein AAF726_10425 [Planctomycetota bacterium]
MAVVPAAFAWDRISSPIAWIALYWGVMALVSCLSRGRGSRHFAARYLLATALLMLGAVELALSTKAPPDKVEHTVDYRRTDELLGYSAVPLAHARHDLRIGAEPVFDVEYDFDENGLRVAPPPTDPPPRSSVLCFGCSFMFGTGIENEEAVPYLLQELVGGRHRVYNFALGGWGPHQMLARIESGEVEVAVAEPPAVAIYWAIPDHVWRAAGKRYWDQRGPLYQVAEDGSAELVGSFADLPGPRPEPDRPKGIVKRSWIVRRILDRSGSDARGNELGAPSPEDIERWSAIVRTTRDEIESRFPSCRFHVLLSDRYAGHSAALVAALQSMDVSWSTTSPVLPRVEGDPWHWLLHRYEGHHSSEAASLIASALAEDVLSELEKPR